MTVAAQPLRIFVGSDNGQRVAHQVLAHSIRRHASIPVEITPMIDLPIPKPVDPANWPRAEFSFTRFMVPELCAYQGRAVYLDADMLVFGDVAELASIPFGEASVLCTLQPELPPAWKDKPHFHAGRHTAVLVLDCSRLKWDATEIVGGLDEGRYTYAELVYQLKLVEPGGVADTVPVAWNHLERFDETTRLLHYTVVKTQPWKADKNPHGHLWMAAFAEAMEAGSVNPEDVEEGVAAGYLKPSLASFLHLAPGRRSAERDSAAPRELVLAQLEIARLRGSIEQMRDSRAWKVGTALAGTIGTGRRLRQRARSAFSR